MNKLIKSLSSSDDLRALMSELKGEVNKYKKVDVKRADDLPEDHEHSDTSKIIYPSGMTLKEASSHIDQQMEYEETETQISHEVDCYPTDGAYSLMQVMSKKYGWAQAVPTPGFFGPEPPTMINIQISDTESADIMWGSFTLPGIKGRLECRQGRKHGRSTFVIAGVIKRKYEKEISELARLVREHVKAHSLYKGRAIKLFTDEEGQTTMDTPPEFMQNMNIGPESLIFNAELTATLEAQLFTVIKATAHLRALKTPVKRGLLLTGPYGCGKTLTAKACGQVCVENGWTYIYLDDVRGIAEAVEFASRYQPCVLFAEDIDRVVGTQERTSKVDAVLNNIDGVDGKEREMIVVFTTNHLDKINRAMLRPGRLDGVIHIGEPDAPTAERMIRHYAGERLDEAADISEAGAILAGQIPACIADAVTQAQLYALSLGETDGKLSAQALLNAATAVANQAKTLKDLDREDIVSNYEALGSALANVVEDSVNDRDGSKAEKKSNKQVDEIHQRIV